MDAARLFVARMAALWRKGDTDYAEYLAWVDAGGIPDPVEQPSARDLALAEIDRLERSITDRMWREDAIGSDLLMEIKKQDENGDWVADLDDPRTGKTATQYIAYVNGAIAALRAGL